MTQMDSSWVEIHVMAKPPQLLRTTSFSLQRPSHAAGLSSSSSSSSGMEIDAKGTALKQCFYCGLQGCSKKCVDFRRLLQEGDPKPASAIGTAAGPPTGAFQSSGDGKSNGGKRNNQEIGAIATQSIKVKDPDPTAQFLALRDELIKLRSRRGDNTLTEHKHKYIVLSKLLIDTTQFNLVLSDIIVGVGTDERLGEKIRIKHITIKEACERRQVVQVQTVAFEHACPWALIYVDKVPALVPNAPLPMFTPDNNPPSNAFAVFSGVTFALTDTYSHLMTRNPNNQTTYDIVHDHKIWPRHEEPSTGKPAPSAQVQTSCNNITTTHTHFYDMHGMQVVYQNGGLGTSALLNAIYLCLISDQATATNRLMGFEDRYSCLVDICFDDVQGFE